MLRNNYEISANANNYKLQNPVEKPHRDHNGSQSELLRSFGDVLWRSFCLQQSVLACNLTDRTPQCFRIAGVAY